MKFLSFLLFFLFFSFFSFNMIKLKKKKKKKKKKWFENKKAQVEVFESQLKSLYKFLEIFLKQRRGNEISIFLFVFLIFNKNQKFKPKILQVPMVILEIIFLLLDHLNQINH